MNNYIEFDNIESWCYQLLIIGCVGVQLAIKVGLQAYTVHKIHMPILRIVKPCAVACVWRVARYSLSSTLLGIIMTGINYKVAGLGQFCHIFPEPHFPKS